MKKNIAALVFAILGAVFGVIGALMWSACADTCAGIDASANGYTAGFIILGIGGSVLSLIGGIRAYGFNSGRLALSVIGLLMQIGNLILECVFLGGFSFIMSVWTLLALLMLLLGTCFAAKKE